MRVARIELKEIGPFDEAVLEIPPPEEGQRGELVIFEGPNGSGKTTIAQVIACAAEPSRMLLDDHDTPALVAPLRELRARTRQDSLSTATTIEALGERVLVRDPRSSGAWQEAETAGSPAGRLRWALHQSALGGPGGPLPWAAFAYQGHSPTPVIDTRGPSEIESPPLRGALSFGTVEPASAHFGQLLVNLDYEVAKALKEVQKNGLPAERKDELSRIAASRQRMLDDIARALSTTLARDVTLDFPFGQHAPTILLDGEPIPLALLGEGMRSTLAWLTDLLVRLHRIPWEDAARSPLEQDFWLILDEIDESLHPTMQMRILPALRSLFPNAAIYLTTHSPFVVASAGEGYVFSLRPDERHRVRGAITPRKLERGQSLEWVVEEIFGAETGFIDGWTHEALRAHRADIQRLRRKEAFGDEDWRAFVARRAALMGLNEQVQAVVAMQEVPVARAVEARIAEGAPGAGA
jgi:energy-coupling factor transporter ATP-binding protein EcfA2